jgi:hypothetical protein
MDDFVNVLQKTFKAVVMNQSVRGKKLKKEREIIVETIAEDYSSSVVLFLSGMCDKWWDCLLRAGCVDCDVDHAYPDELCAIYCY